MSISKLFIQNFKGISDEKEIAIKPITIFVGPNSSGKSSCIHALACISQSLRLGANQKPIILDDEGAFIHLGRFIEVIHTKSYADFILLGFQFENFAFVVKEKGNPVTKSGVAVAKYKFRSTKKTQELFLQSAEIVINEHTYSIVEFGNEYRMSHNGVTLTRPVTLKQAFMVNESDIFINTTAADQVFDWMPFISYQSSFLEYSKDIRYLGPFRQPPIRQYPTRGSQPNDVGANGEATITMLANDVLQSKSKEHTKRVSKWLSDIELGKSVSLSRVGTSDMFTATMELNDGKSFPLVDLGFGISQILPVLTQLSFAKPGSTLLFEQPEIHLHTKSVRKLADVFAEVAIEKKCSILIETHSVDLVSRFFKLIREGKIRLEDIIIYRVTRESGESHIKAIDIDQDGDVYERWENGIST